MKRANIYNTLKSLVMLAVGAAIAVVFQKPIEHWFNKRFAKKEISFEIISSSKLSRHEVQEYSKTEGFGSFKLSLDDLIVKDYHLLKIRLRNEGIPIKGNLKFLISIGNKYTKILDIKHIVNSPLNKRIPVFYALPELTWSEKSEYKPSFSWDASIGNKNGGYNIYRSKFKDVGFGRVNAKLIMKTYYRDELGNTRSPLYYKIEAQKGILRSGFSDIIEVLPEARAFESILLDAIWVDPDSRMDGSEAVNNNHVYRSLEEAIEKEGEASIFILWKLREEVEALGNPSNKLREDIKVLYLDDLKFLMGKTDIRLTSGLDEDSEF